MPLPLLDMVGVMQPEWRITGPLSVVKTLTFPFERHRGVLLHLLSRRMLQHPAELNSIQVNQCFSLLSPFLVVHLHCGDLVKQRADF